MTDHEQLARRCEAATGDDADLIREAATLMFGSVPDHMNAMLAAGAYVDAALLMISSERHISVRGCRVAGFASAGLFVATVECPDGETYGAAVTPALALTAAALCAQEKGEAK